MPIISYCDFIADRIRRCLVRSSQDPLEPVHLTDIGRVEYDVGGRGEFRSTTKTIYLWDSTGNEYRVTVEHIPGPPQQSAAGR